MIDIGANLAHESFDLDREAVFRSEEHTSELQSLA